MNQFDNRVYSYVRVDGDSFKNTNDNTREIWDEAVKNGVKDIIDVTESDDTKKCYLVDVSIYHDLLQASREGKDVDPYGIPNVNFTLINRSDSRWEDFKQQRLERGFDSSELWSLDMTITNFILPRLKAFKEENYSRPMNQSMDEWGAEIDKMIKAFEYLKNENLGCDDSLDYRTNCLNRSKVIEEGLQSFCDNLCNLWT